MKTKLFIFMLFLGFTEIDAQSFCVPGTVVKGKNAAYYCMEDVTYFLKVRNIKNTDTIAIRYYTDGTIVPDEANTGYKSTFRYEDMYQAFRMIITDEELEQLKGRRGGLALDVVADEKGNTTEITFQFIKTDPVMTKMSPDRLFLLEQKLKKILRMVKTDPRMKSIRNPKYLLMIRYNELK